MLVKVFVACLIALVVLAFLFPSAILRVLGRLGRSLGDFGRAGSELLSGKEVKGSPLARYESAAGRAVEEKLVAAHPPVPDPALREQVARVGGRLVGGVRRREIPYRFAVVESAEPTAYSVPGGAVIVTRPLVALCGGDEQQLAGVLAHEVAHIDLRHAVEHLAKGAVARTGLRILSMGRGALLARAIGAVEGLIENGYAAGEELAADREAVALAARGGFDPRAYPFFLRSVLERGLAGAGYFRVHPPIPERLRALGG